MSEVKRVLCLFDYACTTGFATVSTNIISRVRAHYKGRVKWDIFAINFFGDPYTEDDDTKVASALLTGEVRDEFGRPEFCKTLTDVDYDLIFIIQDIGIVLPMVEILKKIWTAKKKAGRKLFKSLFYFPIDHRPVKSLFSYDGVLGKNDLAFFDRLISYTEYGRTEILRHRPDLKSKMGVILHGVNTRHFYPLNPKNREMARRDFFGKLSHKFIINATNRNQPRKDIPTTIFGFKEYLDSYNPAALLYLHMTPDDEMGWNLRSIIEQVGLIEGIHVMFPPKGMDNAGAKVEVLNQLYNASDVFLTTTSGEGWGLCVDPSTVINTLTGYKKMSDVVIGDMVLAETAFYHHVQDKITRLDNVLSFDIASCPDVIVTPCHPFYALQLLKRNSKKQVVSECTPKWVEAKHLTPGDYVAIVKPKMNFPLSQFIDLQIDLTKWVDGIMFDETHCWYKMGFSPNKTGLSISDIQQKYGISKSVAEDARAVFLGRKKMKDTSLAGVIARQMTDNGDALNDQFIKINRYIPVNEIFLEAVGWYLAEGSNSKGTIVEFDTHIREKKTFEILNEKLSPIFGIKGTITCKDNKVNLTFYSGVLAKFFGAYCGVHSVNKKLPGELYDAGKCLQPLIRTLLKGDGCIRKNGISFSTTSMNLGWQLRDILIANGIFCSIQGPYPPRGTGNYEYWIVNINGEYHQKLCEFVGLPYNTTIKRKRAVKCMEDDNFFFVKINSINPLPGQREVMDISVFGVHSFCGNGVLLHNTITESMACKLPVVAPLNTSIIEISNKGDNIVGLEEFYPYCTKMDSLVREQCDYIEVAEKLDFVFKNKQVVEEKVQKAYDYVMGITWDKICEQWIEEFDNLLFK